MIDIHCHILPSVDDGPADVKESIAMARMAAADGISCIAATPHAIYGKGPSLQDIQERLSIFNKLVGEEGIKLEFVAGSDLRMTYELTEGIEKRDVPTINGSRYFLLELPDLIPPNTEGLLFAARLKGLVPVITHPERNQSLLMSPDKAVALKSSGALFQITAMSITGEFGDQIKDYSAFLLKKGLVDFVASDAHDAGYRVPLLSAAYKRVSVAFSPDLARKIFISNPSAVIEDREI
ncbi:MAG: tyrosine protein phosphatase [Nitrospirae bacterium]|nr:tyrosine protein phosphatase [Nitrospirota bacterium]